MNMSKLSNFSNAPISITEENITLKVYPLLAKEQYLFDNIGKANSDSERIKAFFEVVKKSLKDEEVTDDELDCMTLKVQNFLMDAIIEVNGYADKVKYAKEKNIIRKDKTIRE